MGGGGGMEEGERREEGGEIPINLGELSAEFLAESFQVAV